MTAKPAYEIPTPTLQAILEYLSNRPWKEVYLLIPAISSPMQQQAKENVPGDQDGADR